MKDVLGPHAKYSNALVELTHEIANGTLVFDAEFIVRLSDDANKKCLEKARLKISIENVKETLKVTCFELGNRT